MDKDDNQNFLEESFEKRKSGYENAREALKVIAEDLDESILKEDPVIGITPKNSLIPIPAAPLIPLVPQNTIPIPNLSVPVMPNTPLPQIPLPPKTPEPQAESP